MMRQSETMRAASRLLLSHPIVCLFAALAAVVVLGALGPLKVVYAADTAVEGESFTRPASGTNVITGAGYSGGAALKFTANVTASHAVNCGSPCDVVLMASGGQSGGQATFSVNGSAPQALTSTTTRAYTFHLPDGTSTISVEAGGTGTGHNAVLDVVTFPASGGGTDTTAPETSITSPPSGSVIGTTVDFLFASNEAGSTFECRLVGRDPARAPCSSPKTYTGLTVGTQYTFKVWAKDAAGNVDSTPATRTFTPSGGSIGTDTDGDGVLDPTDQCPTKPGPASNNGCPVTTTPDWTCTATPTDTPIRPGDDIDTIINNDPSSKATRFCVYAGRYTVSDVARLKTGDTLDAEPGTWDWVGPAKKPTPKVELVGSSTDNLLSTLGGGITIKWVDLSGASGTGNGTGSAIAAGSADSKLLVQYSRIHNNDSVGISNAKGHILDSEFFSNSEASASIGFNGSAIKGITQFEAGRLYVHDEQGNGIWCDVGCAPDSVTNGFWVHDSVVVRSDRAGIRYENSATGALFENNEIHANGLQERRGGVDIRDSQNATVKNNNFGPETISGVSYAANGDKIGARATDSGRSDRVNLANIDVIGNNMDGDSIVSCGGQVFCSNNTNVGTR